MAQVAFAFTGPTLAATDSKTCVLVAAAAGRKVRAVALEIYGDSNTQTDKNVQVEIIRAASDGTGSALTPRFADGAYTATPTTTGKENYTVEPGTITVAARLGMAAAGGREKEYLDGRMIESAVGGFIGVRVTNPTGNGSVTPKGTLFIEE